MYQDLEELKDFFKDLPTKNTYFSTLVFGVAVIERSIFTRLIVAFSVFRLFPNSKFCMWFYKNEQFPCLSLRSYFTFYACVFGFN